MLKLLYNNLAEFISFLKLSHIGSNGSVRVPGSCLGYSITMTTQIDWHYRQRMEVFTNYLTNPQYSYKQASISCFVNHGPQILTASVLMVLFEPLGHDCDPRYLKPTILEISGISRLVQNGQFGEYCY